MFRRPSGALAFLTLASLIVLCLAPPLNAQWLKPVRAKHAMVTSQHELASRIGSDIMRRGGNAVDAAIAVGIALAVVYPEAGNIGGGGFMLIRKPDGEVHFIDYREAAPQGVTKDMFIGPNGQLIKGEGSSTLGYRAAAVPGTLAGFEMAFNRYGSHKIPWADLVRPARQLAADGFALSYKQTQSLKDDAATFAAYPDANRIFARDGNLFTEDEVLRQTDLARTLSRVERFGAKEFYSMTTAKMIAKDMADHNGLITYSDMTRYKAQEREAVRGSYRGYPIITVPPPSSGGIVLLEVLNILEGYDLKSLGLESAARYHLLTEAMRRGFADRAEFIGDPDFTKVPVAKLTDKTYASERRADIRPSKASNSRETSHGTIVEGADTTHFTVVDPSGMVVSNTYTLNDLYGSKVVAKGTGVLMNDIMDDFSAQPGKPNLFGLIQGDRNKIEPGKRPLSSMTPTIVLRKDGSFWFAIGGRGGPRITSAVIQAIINVIDFDMNIQQALDAPRVHHQWLPDEIMYEPSGFSPDTLSILTSYGHKLTDRPSNVASMTGIMVDEKGVRLGAIDSRSDGKAVGY
jgi:gamma-glutamyltranspeptidase/glutathione hydrolase